MNPLTRRLRVSRNTLVTRPSTLETGGKSWLGSTYRCIQPYRWTVVRMREARRSAASGSRVARALACSEMSGPASAQRPTSTPPSPISVRATARGRGRRVSSVNSWVTPARNTASRMPAKTVNRTSTNCVATTSKSTPATASPVVTYGRREMYESEGAVMGEESSVVEWTHSEVRPRSLSKTSSSARPWSSLSWVSSPRTTIRTTSRTRRSSSGTSPWGVTRASGITAPCEETWTGSAWGPKPTCRTTRSSTSRTARCRPISARGLQSDTGPSCTGAPSKTRCWWAWEQRFWTTPWSVVTASWGLRRSWRRGPGSRPGRLSSVSPPRLCGRWRTRRWRTSKQERTTTCTTAMCTPGRRRRRRIHGTIRCSRKELRRGCIEGDPLRRLDIRRTTALAPVLSLPIYALHSIFVGFVGRTCGMLRDHDRRRDGLPAEAVGDARVVFRWRCWPFGPRHSGFG